MSSDKYGIEYDKDNSILRVYNPNTGSLDGEFNMDSECIQNLVNALKVHRDCHMNKYCHKDTILRSRVYGRTEILVQSYESGIGRLHQIVLKLPREGTRTIVVYRKKFSYKSMDRRIKYFETLIGGEE